MPSQLTFIGAGNMASAIFGGMIDKGYRAEAITATATRPEHLDTLKARYGINITTDNAAAVVDADVVVLAVKPQKMREVCLALAEAIQISRPLIISVAAGIECEALGRWLGGNLPIIRCMPNTPSLVGAGASGLYATADVSDAQRDLASTLLGTVGLVEWVEEEALIDAVTAVSGSGPAYFFLMIEALEEAGVKRGLDLQSARRLAIHTAFGAAKMAAESELTPAELKRQVMSPGGTTEQAIASFEKAGIKPIFDDATHACAKRARALAAELGKN
ncbi:pyrroline-5-carboxylate reductase [Phytohalomonas tamaricis]|uniref:pyrroline-5-carboxylate reductase n=1 Tax=Phytohalomonas tamaricis TaxID=2081032 RepID=UPI000D0B5076|nr:pyrroline-5-carboxylate reductase [Phytohalomonas tamaricis]